MRAMLDGKRVTLDPAKTLGDGGEATVFLLDRGKQHLAAKVYHAPTIDRARKLEALLGNDDPVSPGDLKGKIPGNQLGDVPIADIANVGRISKCDGRVTSAS